MKILHTADWHIGKILHKQSLAEDLNHFFDWMIQTIEEEDIDLLLVSGDIFDLANPNIRDKEVYYDIMMRLYKSGCQVIITGGNHDSVGELNAPKQILSAINISVIGGAMQELEDELIPVKNASGEIELVVAAVPFLRDRDIRSRQEGQTYESRTEAIREGIKDHYQKLAELCTERYPDVMAITMGHLYARGVSVSDSERDIHVGNQAAVESEMFPAEFKYVALGHIHRPQQVDADPRIQYSGSPIALSFSEKEDEKIVIIVETTGDQISDIRSLRIPRLREISKISGSYADVERELTRYQPDFPLPSFLELEVIEEDFSAVILSKVEELSQTFAENPHFKILKQKTSFQNQGLNTAELFEQGTSIEELKPKDVFERKIDSEELDEESRKLLLEAFTELMEMM